LEKWGEIAADFVRHPEFRTLIAATLLATIALTVQAAYLLRRPRWADPWWRIGCINVAMMALLGTAVWEGHPGAATRVLLPMGVAFAILTARDHARWAWVMAGSLSVGSGVLALWEVPQQPRELAAGRLAGGSYVVSVEEGWYGVERRGRAAWAWSASRGSLTIETAPAAAMPRRARLKLRAMSPRELEVRQGEAVLFRGTVGTQSQWIQLPAIDPRRPRPLRFELRSPEAPVLEGGQPGARALGFAVQGVELD
jgi:hypothetical protein